MRSRFESFEKGWQGKPFKHVPNHLYYSHHQIVNPRLQTGLNPFSLSHFFCPSKSKSKTEEENWHPINHSLEIRGGGRRIGEHTIVGEDAEEEEVKDKGERGFHLRKQLRGSVP